VALGVLAILAIMATSFITLMRLDTRVTRNYVDDQRCELLAHGMLNYFRALLREDLDRTWGRYENRDCGVGFYSRAYSTPDIPEKHIPGFEGHRWGTPVCNDFWFSAPWLEWGAATGNLYAGTSFSYYGTTQQSFAWNDKYGNAHGIIGRYQESVGGYEFDVFLGRSNNNWDSTGRTVASNHVDTSASRAIDDDMDGEANPVYVYGSGTPFYYENTSVSTYYYDRPPFVIFSGPTYYQPGSRMTGESTLAGGLYWMWGVKVGPTHSAYANFNVHGNLDGTASAYLNDMGGLGLKARQAAGERNDTLGFQHLGRIEWKGFTGEYDYTTRGGFPRGFNNVQYAPAAANLERLFQCSQYPGVTYGPGETGPPNVGVDREKARAIIRHRWGADGLPATGHDRWRVGWRRDGASYYKFASPENPLGNDRYFGANEVMEHDHSVDHPGTSAVAAILGDVDWRKLRPHVTMWSTDTILRGKIWPGEGHRFPGDWRHIDILKRVNPNIIGASGPEGLPGEDGELKAKWAVKAPAERTRLYTMLVAAMRFSDTANASQKACQFIASLTDMIDRDHEESYFAAPDGTGWALGVEKHPVINEVVFYSKSLANTANYELFRIRVELYNPMENIPWIPDADETYDISEYTLRIGNNDYRVGSLMRYGIDVNQALGLVDQQPEIGADGMYGDPDDPTLNKQSWSRFAHLGWAGDWPPGLTRAELEAPLTFSLWKPLYGDALLNVGVAPGMVEMVGGRKSICVDKTPAIRLVKPYTSGGPGGTKPIYLGIYRRWDPMNAKVYGTAGTDPKSNVLWCPGQSILTYPTLGRPNTDYPPLDGAASSKYERKFERNFKIVDGDIPSVGWLGELMMMNCAQDGPLTWVHTSPQTPWLGGWSPYRFDSELDTKAKFDLYRPFRPARKYSPTSTEVNPVNLHVLDVFTIWDPSNDGIDNDGDGAVDDDDTGRQNGDKGGPEVRVFGRLDANMISSAVMAMAWPDGKEIREDEAGSFQGKFVRPLSYICSYGRSGRRTNSYYGPWGPFETIGDFMRADRISPFPGSMICGSTWANSSSWEGGSLGLGEFGIARLELDRTTRLPIKGDDDGDGIYDERDERDLIFTWIANHYTTRANLFEVDINVRLCQPPYHPGRKLPYPAYKSQRELARKQLLAILDRSPTLRVNADGTCGFNGPVEVRMLRMTDDLRVY